MSHASELVLPANWPPAQVVELQERAAELFGLCREDLLGQYRSASVTRCRHLAMLAARRRFAMSYPEFGRAFQRDHTTVIAACRSAERAVGCDARMREALEALVGEGAVAVTQGGE